jgi:hypothetical protein
VTFRKQSRNRQAAARTLHPVPQPVRPGSNKLSVRLPTTPGARRQRYFSETVENCTCRGRRSRTAVRKTRRRAGLGALVRPKTRPTTHRHVQNRVPRMQPSDGVRTACGGRGRSVIMSRRVQKPRFQGARAARARK